MRGGILRAPYLIHGVQVSTTTHVLFGLHTDSGQLVDVSGVKNGLACGCICPSCNLPLEARQGEIRNWHFAHSSRSGNRVETACDFSFAVSVRMMVRQLASETDGLSLRLPKLEKTYHHTDPRYCSFAVPYRGPAGKSVEFSHFYRNRLNIMN